MCSDDDGWLAASKDGGPTIQIAQGERQEWKMESGRGCVGWPAGEREELADCEVITLANVSHMIRLMRV